MTHIKELIRNSHLIGFDISGHAEYAIKDDIVCAAITVLTINTINSLYQITNSVMEESEVEDGKAVIKLVNNPTHDEQLVLKIAQHGYKDLAETYQNYISYE